MNFQQDWWNWMEARQTDQRITYEEYLERSMLECEKRVKQYADLGFNGSAEAMKSTVDFYADELMKLRVRRKNP